MYTHIIFSGCVLFVAGGSMATVIIIIRVRKKGIRSSRIGKEWQGNKHLRIEIYFIVSLTEL